MTGAELWNEYNNQPGPKDRPGCGHLNGPYRCEMPADHPGEHRRQLGTSFGQDLKGWHVWSEES